MQNKIRAIDIHFKATMPPYRRMLDVLCGMTPGPTTYRDTFSTGAILYGDVELPVLYFYCTDVINILLHDRCVFATIGVVGLTTWDRVHIHRNCTSLHRKANPLTIYLVILIQSHMRMSSEDMTVLV